MSKKEELKQRHLFWQPEIVFDGTPGGKKLVMIVDAFNGHNMWEVQAGDHCMGFSDFEDALEEYCK